MSPRTYVYSSAVLAIAAVCGLLIKTPSSPAAPVKTDAVVTQVAATRPGETRAAHPAGKEAAATRVEVRRTPEEIETIKGQIEEATVQYAETTLPQFEKWLQDPSPEIRAAAVDGLLQSGLQGGAPLLRAAAAASKDPEEIENDERAASILELPPAKITVDPNAPARKPAKQFNLKDRNGSDAPEPAPEAPSGH